MKIYYDDSYAGAGKTEQAIKQMVKSKRKTLFFAERIESFDELERRINKQAGIDGAAPIIDKVYSAQTDRLGSVSRQIEALPERHRHHDHVIVIATHAGMLRSDFSGFPAPRCSASSSSVPSISATSRRPAQLADISSSPRQDRSCFARSALGWPRS